jgi:hypothetical protein
MGNAASCADCDLIKELNAPLGAHVSYELPGSLLPNTQAKVLHKYYHHLSVMRYMA